jgi:hypothetical protein
MVDQCIGVSVYRCISVSVYQCIDYSFTFCFSLKGPPRPDIACARLATPPFSRVARVGGEIRFTDPPIPDPPFIM